MMRLIIIILIIGLLIGLISANPDQAQAVSKAHFEFSLDLYRTLINSEDRKNIVVSPYNLNLVLSMLFLGTTSSSNSSKQLRSMMHFDGLSYVTIHNQFKKIVANFDGNYYQTKMNMARGLYVASNITVAPPYDRALREFYHSKVEHVEFGNADHSQTRGLINEYVEEVTGFRDILEDVPNADTRLLVVDAMTLATRWLHSFEKSATFNKGLFFTPDNQR